LFGPSSSIRSVTTTTTSLSLAVPLQIKQHTQVRTLFRSIIIQNSGSLKLFFPTCLLASPFPLLCRNSSWVVSEMGAAENIHVEDGTLEIGMGQFPLHPFHFSSLFFFL
jgi:hypothetical protein